MIMYIYGPVGSMGTPGPGLELEVFFASGQIWIITAVFALRYRALNTLQKWNLSSVMLVMAQSPLPTPLNSQTVNVSIHITLFISFA
jgi:hypothetical protein